jgi:hypothetical protein
MIRHAERVVGPWARKHLRMLIGTTVLILLSAVALWVVPTVVTLTDQVDGLSRALDKQRDQAKKLGATPVAPPASKVKEDPATPIPNPTVAASGPTDEQVRNAVAAYFQQHPVVNDTPPDAATVQRFVDAWLAAHPAPSGPAGSPGPNGSPGTSGQDGAAGLAGANGRGITSVACTGGHLVVTYDDQAGTTQDMGDGSCGRGPQGEQGPAGEPGQPVHSYTYTVPGVLGSTTYVCTWDGQSTAAPHYDCQQQ